MPVGNRALAAASPKLGLLFRAKARAGWNRFDRAMHEAPIRLAAAVILIGLIWLGLYGLFRLVFDQFERTPLEATVAIPLVFNFFFVAILAMLTFSNAIIAYGALFAKGEAAYLLASPVTSLDVVTLKYTESLAVSSWSLILLGVPLMLAMAHRANDPIFYLLFLAFFLAFIPIPGSIGLLLAWAAAQFLPRRALHAVAVLSAMLVALFVIWGMQGLRLGESATEAWLRSFLARMSFVESAFLPNSWVAAGIDHALQNDFSKSVLYLGVTLANAFFCSWVAVRIVARYVHRAYDRASTGRSGGQRPASSASGGTSGLMFFYLPLPLRLIAAKDLRTFLRDPLQWTQLLILFGLLALYLTNMPTIRFHFGGSPWFLIIPFLNLCAISLILATFTCRFVFPLVSIEGQQLWLVNLLPIRRGAILLAKFAFAMTVTLLVAVGAMSLSAFMLHFDRVWTVIHLAVMVAICFGLCGFSVGIGARLPMFDETNVARIANGLGGTANLLGSVALVTVVLAAVGAATWRSRELPEGSIPDLTTLTLCALAVMIGVTAGATALSIGATHLDRVEV